MRYWLLKSKTFYYFPLVRLFDILFNIKNQRVKMTDQKIPKAILKLSDKQLSEFDVKRLITGIFNIFIGIMNQKVKY